MTRSESGIDIHQRNPIPALTVCGIDVSSFAIDVVLLDLETNNATWQKYELAGGTPFERARSLRGIFPTRSNWEDHGVCLIGIEDPHSRHAHTAKAMGLAAGAVAALLPRHLAVIQTPPVEWKRLTVGNPNAKKEDVAAWAATFGFTPNDLNATDAYAIARAVRRLNNEAITKGSAA